MASTASYASGILVAILAVLLSSITLLPSTLDRLQVNTASISRELQLWRSRGSYYVHTKPDATTLGIFHIDDSAGRAFDGPTLLLLHGFPSTSYDFKDVWEDLKSKYARVITLDLLGYGFSDKPRTAKEEYTQLTQADVVEGLLQQLGVQSTHILAHDIGDTVAQELLARFNDRTVESSRLHQVPRPQILSLCFLNGGLFPEQHRASFMQKLLNNELVGPFVSAVSTYNMFAKTFSSVFGPQTQPSQHFLQDTYALLKFNGGKLILPQLLKYMAERRAQRERWVGGLINSKCPIGLINGPADPISGRHAAERYRELIPDPWVHILEDHIGHYPHVEAPQAVLAAYQKFLQHITRRQL